MYDFIIMNVRAWIQRWIHTNEFWHMISRYSSWSWTWNSYLNSYYGMSYPSWQWHRTGSCWSSVRALPVGHTNEFWHMISRYSSWSWTWNSYLNSFYGMSYPSWQWHRTGSCCSSVRTLPVAPLWCDLGFVPNSRGNKAAANLRPIHSYLNSYHYEFI